jgi:hypothetical protein
MTYGDNGRQVRAGLAVLLRQHRIQHRLGGRGIHTLPESTTPEQREELGQLIQRYRYGALARRAGMVLERGRGRQPADQSRRVD